MCRKEMVEKMVWKVWKKLFGLNVYKEQDVWYNNNIKRKGELKMENLAKVLGSYASKKFKVTNGKINQLERNAFKSEFVSALAKDLESAGLTVGSVDKGFAVLVENDDLGSITIVLDGVVKGLDYDFDAEINAEAIRQAEKAEKAAKAKAKKAVATA
jgi:hypothetical protein